jgi:hypothetical protein
MVKGTARFVPTNASRFGPPARTFKPFSAPPFSFLYVETGEEDLDLPEWQCRKFDALPTMRRGFRLYSIRRSRRVWVSTYLIVFFPEDAWQLSKPFPDLDPRQSSGKTF